MTDRDLHTYQVSTCANEGKHLTAWEKRFLEALEDKLERGMTLSPKEAATLQRVYEERVQ